uniref:Thioredoxin-like fold domain-containing protein n=1 Tax=Spongospora subterranea TaxID=70186 RepID=A0A0H5REQ4_9EUKA|eukprot:CRZ12017.1 hypothetical protein [Spongospora subterranea]
MSRAAKLIGPNVAKRNQPSSSLRLIRNICSASQNDFVINLNVRQDEQSINSLDHINFLNSEYNKYEDDFAMLAMFEESSETVMNFVQKVQSKLGYRIAIDRQRHSDELRKNCNIVGYKTPVAFVVNSDGQGTDNPVSFFQFAVLYFQ